MVDGGWMVEHMGSLGLPRGFSKASVWFSGRSRRLPLSEGSTHTSVSVSFSISISSSSSSSSVRGTGSVTV